MVMLMLKKNVYNALKSELNSKNEGFNFQEKNIIFFCDSIKYYLTLTIESKYRIFLHGAVAVYSENGKPRRRIITNNRLLNSILDMYLYRNILTKQKYYETIECTWGKSAGTGVC